MKMKASKKSAATKVKAAPKAAAATPEKATPAKVAVAARTSLDVATDALAPAPWNPRGKITLESVADLIGSITSMGIIEPVVAMRGAGGKYIIIAGHRRVAAAKFAGLATIPCDVLAIDEAQARRMTFIENLQRKDADPLLESMLVGNLIADGMSQAEIAAETGRGEKWIARRLNLSKLSPSWRKRIADGEKITTDCLEHIAAYPEAIQERLKKTCGYHCADGVLHWSDIRRDFVNESRDLEEADFDCSKCYGCGKNSGCSPSLFDFDGGKNPALGRCLDPACYKRKLTKHYEAQIEAAKADGAQIVNADPTYTGKKMSSKKTAKCNTLYTWTNYNGEKRAVWSEPKKVAAQTKGIDAAAQAYEEEKAAERKEKRERNKAIRKLAEWCGGGTAGEPCNLAKLLDEHIECQPYANIALPFAVFAIQHAFDFVGWSSWELIGTNTAVRDCAISALFGNLTVPDTWTSKVAAEIINSLNPSRGGGWQAERNAVLILRMLGADAAIKVGADVVAAIIPKDDDIEKFRNPQIKWLGEGEKCDPHEPCDDDKNDNEEGGAE